MAAASNHHQEVLNQFYQRASEAEDRLSRLEASLGGTKVGTVDDGNGELSKKVHELQSQLKAVKVEQALEREKYSKELQQSLAENAKFQYRIIHLVHALEEADSKLSSK